MRKRLGWCLCVVGCLVLVAAAPGVATAGSKADYPTDPEAYLPATVGSVTVIRYGGTCPPGTDSPFAALPGSELPPAPDALAAAYPCNLETHPPMLLVFSPAQLQAYQDGVGEYTKRLPGVTKKKVSGINIKVYRTVSTDPNVPKDIRDQPAFWAFGTTVRDEVVLMSVAGDKKTALAGIRSMLAAARGDAPSLP